VSIDWHYVDALDEFAKPASARENWCKVLVVDLRDPRVLPMLAPSPGPDDYRDEARPATNDRLYFLARRTLTRSLVGVLAGVSGENVRVIYDDDGAPRVDCPGGFFVSLSGHGPYAMIAVANRRCGVDFEPLQDDLVPVSDVLHPQEQVWLEQFSGPERSHNFLRIWTAKEAYLKARGRGFLDDPREVCISISSHVDIFLDGNAVELDVSFRNLALDGANIVAAGVLLRDK